jgi:hypothetical protein
MLSGKMGPHLFLSRKNAGEDKEGAHSFPVNMLCWAAALPRWVL